MKKWRRFTGRRWRTTGVPDPDATDRRAVLKAAEAVLDVPVVNSTLYEESQVAGAINDHLAFMRSMSVAVPLLFVGIMMLVLL